MTCFRLNYPKTMFTFFLRVYVGYFFTKNKEFIVCCEFLFPILPEIEDWKFLEIVQNGLLYET